MQISMFDGTEKLKITKPIRLIELFAGIGSQAKALKNLGVNFEHYRICEFDKYAVQSYNAIHGTNFETSDITKITANDLGIVDTVKYCYIMTYSFPCQDLSNAGLGKGMAKGSGTRSGLLWEVERLLDECVELPQILVMENVPEVIGTNNIKHFAKWVEKLESFGYKCKWDCLNAKNYGIPQNRDRCFMVSFLGDYFYDFPKPKPLTLRLKDMLEKEVDEKYYLSDKMVRYIMADNETWIGNNKKALINRNIGVTINTKVGTTRADCSDYICESLPDNFNLKEVCAYDEQNGRGIIEPKVLGGIGEKKSNNGTQWYQQDRIYDNELAISVTTGFNPHYLTDYRIRKLTPKECWRLMGFADADIDKAIASGMSNAQLYKQAGNSICVPVLEYIFKEML